MERFINILIIDQDPTIRFGLKEILSGGGNNVLTSNSFEEAIPVIKSKEIGIIIINIDDSTDEFTNISALRENSVLKNNYIIIIKKEDSPNSKLIKGMKRGAVDYIPHPFHPNLIKSKIDVFKSLYHKDQRIGQLLGNIFPATVLEELSTSGKYSPKRIENGVVLFTDFIDFSLKAKAIKPLRLIQQLEKHFTKFDEIVTKYNLEKIKTIGDAYMVLAGLTEEKPEPAIRACMAAVEIRDYVKKQGDVAIATKKDFWEIRIGLHMGPLVAGIIGSTKYSFDIWGDTVNIAAQAETATESGTISVTTSIYQKIKKYFDTTSRGNVDIQKRGGAIEMFYLDRLKREYCMYNEGLSPNAELRVKCGLSSIDFEQMRENTLNRLKSLLPENIYYHDLAHTLNVEKAAIRYGKLEGVDPNSLLLLRTAVLFHDAGFIMKYDHNEDFGVSMAQANLPKFGYSESQIEVISKIINATKQSVSPTSLLEKIMCDADHDYLGRPDYHVIAKKLRAELSDFETSFTDEEWIEYQIQFLENVHQYYTETAKNIREQGKKARIAELKMNLNQIKAK
jgi:class 3 adenylate cyclase/predicted metal-dependent HD superfamily phosphohydrolase/ActR/RegA family two-component response regulator